MSLECIRNRRACDLSSFVVLFALVLGAAEPTDAAILRLAGDVFQEIDVLSSTPRTLDYVFPDDVTAVHSMRMWATGKQNLGTFVREDGDERTETAAGAGLVVDLPTPCGGFWHHRSEILPQGTWAYEAGFEWDEGGDGCEADLQELLEGAFSATVFAYPEFETDASAWWQPEPGFFLIAVILEFDVDYAVPSEASYWGRVKALYGGSGPGR